MRSIKLKASKRKIFGRKVKVLRKEGILPANLYGKKIKSVGIQVDRKEFASIYDQAGETNVVELIIDKQTHPVLIQNVQTDPITNLPLHVDFHQVDLKEKVTTQVPIELIGEAPAVKEKIGVLLTLLSQIEVEALPTDLPDKIEIDISKLSAVDQTIKIADLKISDKIKILTDQNLEIVKVAPLVSKEAEKMVKEEQEAAAAAEAKEEAAAEEPVEKKEEEAKKPAEQPAKEQEKKS